MLVSVIIPTYNHRQFLGAALESVFSQTFTDYEVIVVNDGATDGTTEFLQPFINESRIRYFEQTNAGVAAARNRAVAAAKGEYIAFLDDDDVWPMDKLQWQVEFLSNNPEFDLVGGPSKFIDETGAEQAEGMDLKQGEITYDDLFWGCPFGSPGQTLIRRDAYLEVGGMNPDLWGTDDYDLYFRLARRKPMVGVPRIALYYRFHAGAASRNVSRMLLNTHKVLQKQLATWSRPERERYRKWGYRWLYKYLGCQVATQAMQAASRLDLDTFVARCLDLRIFFDQIPADPRLCAFMVKESIHRKIASSEK